MLNFFVLIFAAVIVYKLLEATLRFFVAVKAMQIKNRLSVEPSKKVADRLSLILEILVFFVGRSILDMELSHHIVGVVGNDREVHLENLKGALEESMKIEEEE